MSSNQTSTLLTLPGDLGFMFPEVIPFNTAPRQGVKKIQGSFLYTLRIGAVPVTKQHWREKLAQGQPVRFTGTKQGTNETVEFDARATRSKFSPHHLIITFSPAT